MHPATGDPGNQVDAHTARAPASPPQLSVRGAAIAAVAAKHNRYSFFFLGIQYEGGHKGIAKCLVHLPMKQIYPF